MAATQLACARWPFLCHCHDNLEAFSGHHDNLDNQKNQVSPFPESESLTLNSFSVTVLLLEIKDGKFNCLRICKD